MQRILGCLQAPARQVAERVCHASAQKWHLHLLAGQCHGVSAGQCVRQRGIEQCLVWGDDREVLGLPAAATGGRVEAAFVHLHRVGQQAFARP